MNKRLLVIAGPEKGQSFLLTPGKPLMIGRGKTNDTHLTDRHVSKVHCQVAWDGDDLVVIDQDSTGGTFVNGGRVSRQALRSGDLIRIGETQLRVQEEGPGGTDEADETLAGAGLGVSAAAAAAAGPVEELTGKALSHYAVGPLVARGRSGMIFRGQDTRDNRTVALKVLLPEYARDDEAVQRLVRAMKTMLPLRHPNLVAVYGAGKTGPFCWVAMEYVEGDNLAGVIRRAGTGTLDWRQALRVTIHVGRALEHAHREAIIHRNVTPENVLIRASDQVAKLGDLVLAKALEGMLAEEITRRGEMVGDVLYMSPERTAGLTEVDGRSDLYSLGALAYAVLTGRPPFEGASVVETVEMIREAEPAPLTTVQPAIPAAFAAAVLKLLAKRPEDRHQTAAELRGELDRVAADQGVAV